MSDGPDTPGAWRRVDWGSRWFFTLSAATLAIVALVALFLTRSREDALEREAADLALWANVIGESVERVLFDADTHLVAVADLLRAKGINTPQALKALAGSRETHAWLRELSQRSASLDSLLLVDADGRRVISSRAFPLPSIDLSDRSYFQALKNRPDLSSFVSEPLRNRQIAIDSIYVSQRLNGPKGELAGVMAASVALPRVVRLLDRAEGSGMSVALVRRNGELLALGSESPERAQALLTSELPALRDALAARDQGAWPALGGGDAPPVVAIRALKGYPMAVLTAQPRARALVAWQQQAQWMAAVTGAAVLLLWGLGALANRQARLRRIASEGERLSALNAELQVQVGERRQAQDALRTLNEELEHRVHERTRELQATLESLHQAQDELVRSEKMASLGALVAGVAHELNTPIGNAMLVASTLDGRQREFEAAISGGLRRSSLDAFLAGLREGSAVVERNLQRAADLIGSFKQVAVDQSSYQRREFDLAEMVQEIALAISPTLKRSGVKVLEQVPAGLCIDSYPGPLGQVLINLVNNAATHAFEEGQPGSVRITAEAMGEGRVRLIVSDDGRGIPQHNLKRIFDPFFTTRLGQGGSGLGLHITYTLVTGLLGGRIEVRSEPGHGTAFTIELPLVAPHGGTA